MKGIQQFQYPLTHLCTIPIYKGNTELIIINLLEEKNKIFNKINFGWV
jgi:hypothetical protein